MEFNRLLVQGIKNLFLNREDSTYKTIPSGILFDKHNVFNLGLKVDVRDDTFEIPVIGTRHFESLFINSCSYTEDGNGLSFKRNNLNEIIFPLFSGGSTYGKRTFDSIIKAFFFQTPMHHRLRKITTNKGDIFYGGRGIVLDNNYVPLLLCNMEMKKINSGTLSGKILYIRPVLRVSPIVFERNDIICKGIVKKLIPIFSNEQLYMPTDKSSFKSRCPFSTARVLVDDLGKFFVKPAPPASVGTINEDLNKCLEEHIDEVLDRWG